MRRHASFVLVVAVIVAAAAVQQVGAAGRRGRLRQLDDAAVQRIKASDPQAQRAVVPDLLEAYVGDDWGTAMKARSLLLEIGRSSPRSVVPRVVEMLEGTPEDELSVRLPLVELLRDLGPAAKSAVRTLTEALKSDDLSIQQQAVLALRSIGPDARSAVPALTDLLDSRDAAIRSEAVMALRAIGPTPSAVPALTEALDSDDPSVRRYAVQALGRLGPEAADAVPELIQVARTADRFLQLQAVEALGRMGPAAADAIPVLVRISEGKSKVALSTISEALKSIKTENAAPTVRALRGTCQEGESAEIQMPVEDRDDVSVALEGLIVENPDHGTLERTGPTSFIYSAPLGYVGRDSWMWRATDGTAKSSPADAVMEITPDTQPPGVDNVVAVSKKNRVTVEFSEPVGADTAEDADNYSISPGIRVRDAELSEDGKTVVLTTSALSQDVAYTLAVQNVTDRARARNEVEAGLAKEFRFHVWKRAGLVLLARGDGNARDESGQNNHGKLSDGVSYADDGVRGKAFKFSGTGGNAKNTVNFGDLGALNGPATFTIGLWFRRDRDRDGDSNHNISNILFSKGSDNNNDNLEIGTDGPNVEVYLDTDGADENAGFDAGIENGQWYHLALTYDSSRAKVVQLYLDGQRVKSWDTWGGKLDQANGSPVTIGNTHHEETPFEGLIDEVFLFSRVLGDEEIQALAASM